MANTSSAFGRYHFDFSNTKLKGDTPAQKELLLRLADALEYNEISSGEKFPLTYATRLDLQSEQISGDEHYISFTADGRYSYQNNLEWFSSDDSIAETISDIDGLTISIDYTDYEFGMMQILIDGGCLIKVENGEVIIVHDEHDWEDLTPKTYFEAKCGDFWDMVHEFSLDEFDLTDEQLKQIAQMDDDELTKHWQEEFKNL